MVNTDLYKPSKLKEICAKNGLRPSKSYGQNFLVSPHPIEKMLAVGELEKNDIVIEVGPGFGVLTFAIAPLVKKIVAFEIEKKLENYWEGKQKEYKNIEIVWGNATKNLSKYLSENKIEEYKVIANLPYQITSQILRTFFELEKKPKSITIMVQKEVAERILAKKGDMNLLALSVQFFGEPRIISKVSSASFWPKPKVESAILQVINIGQPTNIDEFFKIARLGFSSKRKQLWKNLSQGIDLPIERIKEILKDLTGTEKIRAEDLSLGEWQILVEKLKNFV
ncbi:MAG: ribosomal RNA small subunit methyltransferase A [Candidatus Magasanikbacteria bacterium CG_4_9_14_3_um_filter_32_9]|uniref:Ribosomal RNA small subunit methyltransferase A n=1 Tax=Candidatus Magasanikbacteria bacterium CG_4_9_14_3_um_filter_32_9 TaxID=1974644 RepID=A0A2M7Z6Q8_9BACT|nr:MAG: ribosomal RNA small subunit methyltransferase A [Candidatus Magasanikbacteria bacterium CG_4_9_14_3_um_filter_32_9]